MLEMLVFIVITSDLNPGLDMSRAYTEQKICFEANYESKKHLNYLVTKVAQDKLIWEMSELISKPDSMVIVIVCQEHSIIILSLV